MKRGTKPLVTLKDQKTVFLKFQLYFKDKSNLPSPCDPVFSQIKHELNGRMSEKALYISLKRNFNTFFENESDETSSSSLEYSETDKIVLQKDQSEVNADDYCKVFNFSIDIYQWEQIQPLTKYTVTNKLAKKRSLLPKHKWTSLLREKMWDNTRLPCGWIFKSNSVRNGEKITCYGFCNLCKAKIRLVINWPTDKIATCQAIVTGYNTDAHHSPAKKIKMSPWKRRELCKDLKCETAIIVQKKMANEIMSTGDPEPSHLPSVGCLRQIKYEHNSSERYDSNPVLSLWVMTQIERYSDIIRQISLYPFYLLYWSPGQESHYENNSKSNRVIVSIDATGSILKELRPTHQITTTKHIFLYSAVMYDIRNGRSVPITQMLSESHTMNTIYTWLHTWIRKKSPPSEVITDDSSAIIGAVVKAFTAYETTKDYIKASYNKLNQNMKSPLECYIRIDTSHFVKILCNLSCFRHVDYRVRSFYIKCLLYIKNHQSYDEVRHIITDLITVSLNKFIGQGSNCESAKMRLQSKIRAENENEITDTTQLKIDYIFDDVILDSSKEECVKNRFQVLTAQTKEESNVPKWFKDQIEKEQLLVTLSDNDVGVNENLFYMPSFISTLSRLMTQLPLWGNIMMPAYNSNNEVPSSSNVESSFKNIKRYLLNICTKNQRLRVDDFIKTHTQFLSGEIKTAISAENSEPKKVNTKTKTRTAKSNINIKTDYTDESIFNENPTFIENWQGLGKTRKQNQNIVKNMKKITLLANGTVTTTGKIHTMVSNTCAFDSTAYIIAVGCADGFEFNTTVITNNENSMCRFIRQMLDSKTSKQDLYRHRAAILENHFDKKKLDNTYYIGCECSVTTIFERILIDVIRSADLIESCSNELCSVNNVRRKIHYLGLHIGDKGISSLSQLAVDVLSAENNIAQCRRNDCNGIRTITYDLHNIVIFELSQTDYIQIDDVPKQMTLNDVSYDFLGLIEFIPPSSNPNIDFNSIGHYRAHVLRNHIWHCYDDLKHRITKSAKVLIAHCILYAKK